MTVVWLVIIALILIALTQIGIAVRNTPWLNDDNPHFQHRMDPESRGFFE